MYASVSFTNIFLNFTFIFTSGCKNDTSYSNFFIAENIRLIALLFYDIILKNQIKGIRKKLNTLHNKMFDLQIQSFCFAVNLVCIFNR